SDDGVKVAFTLPVCFSGDGRKVIYSATIGTIAQVLLFEEGRGNSLAIFSSQGELPLVSIVYATLSRDGRWLGFATQGTNLVPDDINGFTDVFVRGPL